MSISNIQICATSRLIHDLKRLKDVPSILRNSHIIMPANKTEIKQLLHFSRRTIEMKHMNKNRKTAAKRSELFRVGRISTVLTL